LRYQAFNLQIESDIPLLHYNNSKNPQNADLFLKELNIDHLFKNFSLEISDKKTFSNSCLIFLKDKIFFEIDKNYRINFQRISEISDLEVSKLICNLAIPMLFVLNDKIVLHASALRIRKKTILFSGKSGSGKSTAALHFLANGAKLISEDICVFSNDYSIVPSYPVIHAKECSVTKSKINEIKGCQVINNNLPKKMIKTNNFYQNQSKPDFIFFLDVEDKSACSKIQGADSFMNMLKNSWHSYPFHELKDRTSIQLKNISQICENTSTYKLTRDATKELFDEEIYDLVKDIINS